MENQSLEIKGIGASLSARYLNCNVGQLGIAYMQISENTHRTRQPVQSLQITDNHLQIWSVKRELASTKVGHHMILGGIQRRIGRLIASRMDPDRVPFWTIGYVLNTGLCGGVGWLVSR